ncbi:hypothetical protein JCM33374_g4603 [Metschnikowia sp. JCM 33374]|nr:hypothetical protein JCM33374_g4603 [Metschnikowia sp. JCM 33374]
MALNHSQSQTRPSNFGQNGPCHDVVGVHIATSIPSNFPEHHNQLKHRKPVTFTPGHPYRPVHPIKYELGQSLKETFPAREIGCNIEGIAHMTGWPYPKPWPSMEIPPFSMLEPSNTKVACPDSLEMVSCPDFHYNNSPRYPPSDGSASTSLSSAIHNLSSDPLHIVPQHDWKVLNVSSPELPNQCPRQSTQAENVQGVYNSIPQTKISDDAIKTFNRLVSLLNTENSNNVGIFLSEVLKECHFVPLDDVFGYFTAMSPRP